MIGTWLRATALGAMGTMAALGCQSVLGIEDRTFDPLQGDASGGAAGTTGDAAAPSPQCIDYCNLVLSNCKDGNTVYASTEACLGVCAKLPPGGADDKTGNSIACRINQALLAASTGEPETHCPRAAPGGGGTCGDNCEGFCTLFLDACPGVVQTKDTCLAACSIIPQVSGYDIDLNYSEDTLQCRLVHITNAIIDSVDPGMLSVHCDHAALLSQCPCCDADAGGVAPSCETYCGFVMNACKGELAQYESLQQCRDACVAFDLGDPSDTTPNTVACRTYHSNSSLADDATHCPHAGPGGDGHCGVSDCDGYCDLMAEFCPTAFADKSVCQAECMTLPGSAKDQGYTVSGTADGNTVQCRLLEAVRASATPGDAAACDRARGVTACQ